MSRTSKDRLPKEGGQQYQIRPGIEHAGYTLRETGDGRYALYDTLGVPVNQEDYTAADVEEMLGNKDLVPLKK